VAQFKYTIAIRTEGPVIIAGLAIDPARYSSDYKIEDETLIKLLETPQDTFLPNSKKQNKIVKKKDNKEKKKKKKEAKLKKKEELKKKKEEEEKNK